MHTVSLFFEILRTKPRLIFWFAALLQAALWLLVPALFYSAPPGDAAEVIALGREFTLGSDQGPPLAYWLAEIAFRLGGMPGVYLLSQLCVIVTYAAIFALGSAVVGARQAALAVLLMGGVSVFALPTPDFGPAILAMPLWALALLHGWRLLGENRPLYSYALAFDIGLLLLTTYMGLVLLALLVGFLLANERAYARLHLAHLLVAGLIVIGVIFPHLIWIDQASADVLPNISGLFDPQTMDKNLLTFARLFGMLTVAHIGLAILVALALYRSRKNDAVTIERMPVDPFARRYVYFFAVAPAVAVTLLATLINEASPPLAAPLLVLSGLAVVIAGGERITLHRQRALGLAWFSLVVAPALLTVVVILGAPWVTASELKVSEPSAEIGRYLGEAFERRTATLLAVVAGEPRLAALAALGAKSRPHVYREDRPDWPVRREQIEEKGAVVIWRASDSSGQPPARLKARFPDMVPEVPRTFERLVEGRLPPFRIGWGMIRPQAQTAPAVSAK